MASQLSSNCSGLQTAGGFNTRLCRPGPPGPLLPYPLSFGECSAWARAAGVSGEIALRRFIAYCVLRCIAGCEKLNRRLIVRGGCALWIRYGSQRPFPDIDLLCQGLDAEADAATTEALTDEINDSLGGGIFQCFPDGPAWEATLLKSVKVEVAPAYAPVPYQWVSLDPVGVGSGNDPARAAIGYSCRGY